MAMHNKSQATLLPVLHTTAAVSVRSGIEADRVLDGVIHSLQQRGVCVAGLRQRVSDNGTSRCGVQLESIRTGRLHRMTQSLGSGSVSCNVDAEAMEQLALHLKEELNDDVDLVVINRFGKRESEGAGFCSVIERAIDLNIPALTVVKEDWLETWLDYGGAWVTTLPADQARILEWFGNVRKTQLSRGSDESGDAGKSGGAGESDDTGKSGRRSLSASISAVSNPLIRL